jgi:hypothetical protein
MGGAVGITVFGANDFERPLHDEEAFIREKLQQNDELEQGILAIQDATIEYWKRGGRQNGMPALARSARMGPQPWKTNMPRKRMPSLRHGTPYFSMS